MSEAVSPPPPPAPAPEAPPAPAAGTPPVESSPLGVAPAAEGEAPKPAAGKEGAAHEGDAAPEGEDKPAGGEKPAEGDAPAPLTPESYEFKLPEGVEVDAASLTTLKQTLSENKVPVEAAQALMDMHLAELNKSAEAFAANQKAAWDSLTQEWKTAIDADPELGGDKKGLVTSTIAQALDEYGTPETRAAFDMTGSGWNPSIIKFIYKMAAQLREGTPHAASGPSSNRTKTPGQVLYENDGNGPSPQAS